MSVVKNTIENHPCIVASKSQTDLPKIPLLLFLLTKLHNVGDPKKCSFSESASQINFVSKIKL